MKDFFGFNMNSDASDIRVVYDFYAACNKLLGIQEFDNWLTFKLKADGNLGYYKTEKYFKPRALRAKGIVS